jgi:hypothetical protein
LKLALKYNTPEEVFLWKFCGPNHSEDSPQYSDFFGSAQTTEEALNEPRALAVLDDVTAPPLNAPWREKLLGILKDLLLDNLIVDEQKAFALPVD